MLRLSICVFRVMTNCLRQRHSSHRAMNLLRIGVNCWTIIATTTANQSMYMYYACLRYVGLEFGNRSHDRNVIVFIACTVLCNI